MKPKKYNNFKMKGNGELVFFDDDVYGEDEYSRIQVFLKLKERNILVATVWRNRLSDLDDKQLGYLDSKLDALLGEKTIIDKALYLLFNKTDFYEQMNDMFVEDHNI